MLFGLTVRSPFSTIHITADAGSAILACGRRLQSCRVKIDEREPPRQAIVDVKLRDGRQVVAPDTGRSWIGDNPMPQAEVAAKASIFRSVLGRRRAREILRAVARLETVPMSRRSALMATPTKLVLA